MDETLIKIFWLIIAIVWIGYGLFGSLKENPGLRFMARVGMIIVGIDILIRHLSK